MKKIITLLYLLVLFGSARAQNVIQAEYFIDTDPGFGNAAFALIPAADSTWQLPTITTSGLALGYHKLYLRTKDSNGMWSHTARYNFEIVPSLDKDSVMIGEWFIDTDPSFGSATPIIISNQDSNITQLLNIPASAINGLSIGYHKLYGRMKDNNGKWSHTFRKNIEVIQTENQMQIVEVEYFFVDSTDLGFGNCHSFYFPLPFADDSVVFNIPYYEIPFQPNDVLFMRVRDSVNARWSHTVYVDSLNIIDVTGINEQLNHTEFVVYPNPANNYIIIEFKNNIEQPLVFELINTLGQIVQQKEINNRLTKISIEQPAGVYFIRISSEKGTVTRKININ
ncbi:MAG: T9SS type A sorting domain-containing protein [Bacteroidia bacterium]|nr:T9SS type A sorting domain-containing protein [Bacteroidia bacterium]